MNQTQLLILIILIFIVIVIVCISSMQVVKARKNTIIVDDQRKCKKDSSIIPPEVVREQPFDPAIENRFRSFANTGGEEIYIGPNAGAGGFPNRVASDFSWTPDSSHPFSISYDPNDDTMSVDLDGTTLDYNSVNPNVNPTNDAWDTVQFYIANRDTSTIVNINNLTVTNNDAGESFDLGDFVGTSGAWDTYYINFDWSGSWTIEGEIQLGGTFSSSQEKSKVGFIPGTIVSP